jgi:hypothetical protein
MSHRARVRRFVLRASASFLFLLLVAAPASAEIDLIGSWFVLIHYRDSQTANPDSDRWEDKVWKIEKKGSRLQWTEYPIVVFNDGSGRFGRVGRNPRSRLLHKWEPNEAQMQEILEGVQVNSRGSKTKALRGSPERGFQSTSLSRTVSAFTVGYQETWSIDDVTVLPVFTRDDALGTESALATQGLEIPKKTLELIGRVREGLGEEKLARLQTKYAQRIQAGDEKAKEELAEEIRAAYMSALEADFMKRLQAGDPEAMR